MDKTIRRLALAVAVLFIIFLMLVITMNQPKEYADAMLELTDTSEIKEPEATQEQKEYYENLKRQEEAKKAKELRQQKLQEALDKEDEEEEDRDIIMASESTFPDIDMCKGVNYYKGLRQTFYQSSVLPHQDKGAWHTDQLGFYRDASGYIVIAYGMKGYGSIIKLGPKCWGKVLDHCPTPGTVDIYVGW